MPEIESINRRLEELEEKTKENFKMINEIKDKLRDTSTDIRLIQNDTEYMKKVVDSISVKIDILSDSRISDQYIIPLSAKEKREEQIIMLIKTIIYGGIAVYVLSQLFPAIGW